MPDAETTYQITRNTLNRLFLSFALLFILLFIRANPDQASEEVAKIRVSPKGNGPYVPSVDFLVRRIDALEKAIDSTRSGASILAGVFSGLILWFTNLGRALSPIETGVLYASGIAVLLILYAIMVSFRIGKVKSSEGTLCGDLLPSGQPEEVFKEQLREMVKEKHAVIRDMKEKVGLAIVAFIELVGIIWVGEMYFSFPALSVWYAYWVIHAISVAVLTAVLFLSILVIWDQLGLE